MKKKRGGRRIAQRGGFAPAVAAVPAIKALVTTAVINKLGKKAAVALGHYVFEKRSEEVMVKEAKEGEEVSET